jgi:hypothetical protein
MNEFIESFLSKPIFVFTLIAFAITCLWVMIESRKQILFVSFFIPLFLFLTFYTYITIQSIEGYATEQKIQKEFTLHWYTIEENKYILIWITEDDKTEPRVHRIKYQKNTAKNLNKLKSDMRSGRYLFRGKKLKLGNESAKFQFYKFAHQKHFKKGR